MNLDIDNYSKAFIAQTARDYDMPIHEVERIYKKYPQEDFYKELELYISNRY